MATRILLFAMIEMTDEQDVVREKVNKWKRELKALEHNLAILKAAHDAKAQQVVDEIMSLKQKIKAYEK